MHMNRPNATILCLQRVPAHRTYLTMYDMVWWYHTLPRVCLSPPRHWNNRVKAKGAGILPPAKTDSGMVGTIPPVKDQATALRLAKPLSWWGSLGLSITTASCIHSATGLRYHGRRKIFLESSSNARLHCTDGSPPFGRTLHSGVCLLIVSSATRCVQ